MPLVWLLIRIAPPVAGNGSVVGGSRNRCQNEQ